MDAWAKVIYIYTWMDACFWINAPKWCTSGKQNWKLLSLLVTYLCRCRKIFAGRSFQKSLYSNQNVWICNFKCVPQFRFTQAQTLEINNLCPHDLVWLRGSGGWFGCSSSRRQKAEQCTAQPLFAAPRSDSPSLEVFQCTHFYIFL